MSCGVLNDWDAAQSRGSQILDIGDRSQSRQIIFRASELEGSETDNVVGEIRCSYGRRHRSDQIDVRSFFIIVVAFVGRW